MGVYEVYYRADDTIWAWSENPISPTFDNKEDWIKIQSPQINILSYNDFEYTNLYVSSL